MILVVTANVDDDEFFWKLLGVWLPATHARENTDVLAGNSLFPNKFAAPDLPITHGSFPAHGLGTKPAMLSKSSVFEFPEGTFWLEKYFVDVLADTMDARLRNISVATSSTETIARGSPQLSSDSCGWEPLGRR